MAEKTHAFYKFEQVRVTPLLESGAPDPSGVAVTSTVPKELKVKYIYKEGEEAEQTAAGDVFCTITEADQPKGADIDLTLATLEYELKAIIAGGDVKTSGDDTTGWEFPTAASAPFMFEAWIPAFEVEEGQTEGMTDGYLKITCPYCKGRVADRDHGEKKWGEDNFSIRARQNPYSGDTAYSEEEVTSLT